MIFILFWMFSVEINNRYVVHKRIAAFLEYFPSLAWIWISNNNRFLHKFPPRKAFKGSCVEAGHDCTVPPWTPVSGTARTWRRHWSRTSVLPSVSCWRPSYLPEKMNTNSFSLHTVIFFTAECVYCSVSAYKSARSIQNNCFHNS